MTLCELVPVGGSHAPIELADSEPLIIGRNRLTEIKDRRCSRQQIEVCADCSKKEVHIRHLGFHPSQIATKILCKGDCFILGPMAWFELLQGSYKYHVYFRSKEPVNKSMECESEPPPKKQKTIESFLERDVTCLSGIHLPVWREGDNFLVFQYGPIVHSTKIASFDLDNTIIETLSGKKFATGSTDWKLMNKVVTKLTHLSNDGYKIVIFTNQLGINRGKPTKTEFKHKMESIAIKLRIPLLVMAAIMKDLYRKPCMGMWNHFLKEENGLVKVDKNTSFYVGDAAGREDKWIPGRKKDFSCADRKFASNIGLSFYTPEEFFLNYPSCTRYSFGDFNPTTLDCHKQPYSFGGAKYPQEMIVLVGCPASGKSSFFNQYLEPNGYSHVNRDILGSWQKCVAKCKEYLKAGTHVAVDNTSPDENSRKRYIDVAKTFEVPVRCFQFMTSIDHAKHNNRFRELTMTANNKAVQVNDMVFNVYKSKFVEPSCIEGFADIVQIPFSPQFKDKCLETLYYQFLL